MKWGDGVINFWIFFFTGSINLYPMAFPPGNGMVAYDRNA